MCHCVMGSAQVSQSSVLCAQRHMLMRPHLGIAVPAQISHRPVSPRSGVASLAVDEGKHHDCCPLMLFRRRRSPIAVARGMAGHWGWRRSGQGCCPVLRTLGLTRAYIPSEVSELS